MWEFVKLKVMNFFRVFHEHDCSVSSLNANFHYVDPKKGGRIFEGL